MPRLLELEFSSDVRALSPELMQLLNDAPSADNAMRMMLGLYRSMPATCAPLLARLFPGTGRCRRCVSGGDPRAPAGKDRTGFVIAVLLSVLGVAPVDIRADYLYSNHSSAHLRRNAKVQALLQQLLGMTPDPRAVDALTRAAPEYLDAALSEVRRGFGSVQRYLCEAAGIDEATCRPGCDSACSKQRLPRPSSDSIAILARACRRPRLAGPFSTASGMGRRDFRPNRRCSFSPGTRSLNTVT